MNGSIQVFNYNNTHEVRTVEKDGEVWFVARDVCDVLELTDVSMAVAKLDDDEKLIQKLFVSGQNRDIMTINEAGIYALIFRSNKPEAKQFSRWVRHELLPQVLKTGTYSAYNTQVILPYGVLEGAKFILEDAGIEGNQRTLALDKLYKSYTGQSLLLTTGIELEAPVKEQALTPSKIAELLGIGKGNAGGRIVNALLEDAGYQRKVAGQWEPTELGKPYALVLDTNKKFSNGTPIIQVKWYTSINEIVKNLAQGLLNH